MSRDIADGELESAPTVVVPDKGQSPTDDGEHTSAQLSERQKSAPTLVVLDKGSSPANLDQWRSWIQRLLRWFDADSLGYKEFNAECARPSTSRLEQLRAILAASDAPSSPPSTLVNFLF